MTMMLTKKALFKRQEGSVTIMAAMAAIALLGVGALVLDVGYMMVTRTELQNIADGSSASGSMELARIYDELGNVDPMEHTLTIEEEARIVNHLNTISTKNDAAGVAIGIPAGDVEFGKWDRTTGAFQATRTGVTSTQTTARRDKSANGSVNTLLASVLGIDEFGVSADGGSAISTIGKLPPGRVDFPIGIARAWFEARNSPCGANTEIMFYPTGTIQGCAGWHTFEDWPANAARLKSILRGMRDGIVQSPEITVGQTEFVFTGGTVGSALQAAEELYNAKKDANGELLVHLPVYDYDDCSNPQGRIKIVGIATAIITGVVPKGGNKNVTANVSCDVVGFGEPGGPDYGTWVAKPIKTK